MMAHLKNISVSVLRKLYNEGDLLIDNNSVNRYKIEDFFKIGIEYIVYLEQDFNGKIRPIDKKNNDMIVSILNAQFNDLRYNVLFNTHHIKCSIIETYNLSEQALNSIKELIKTI
jgi:hypothetical protein